MSTIHPLRHRLQCKTLSYHRFSLVNYKVKSVGIGFICWAAGAVSLFPNSHVQLWEKGVGVWECSVDLGGVNSVNLWCVQRIVIHLRAADDEGFVTS